MIGSVEGGWGQKAAATTPAVRSCPKNLSGRATPQNAATLGGNVGILTPRRTRQIVFRPSFRAG